MPYMPSRYVGDAAVAKANSVWNDVMPTSIISMSEEMVYVDYNTILPQDCRSNLYITLLLVRDSTPSRCRRGVAQGRPRERGSERASERGSERASEEPSERGANEWRGRPDPRCNRV